jgi:hypothetical protein
MYLGTTMTYLKSLHLTFNQETIFVLRQLDTNESYIDGKNILGHFIRNFQKRLISDTRVRTVRFQSELGVMRQI